MFFFSFFFFRQILDFCIFRDFWVLRDPRFPPKTKTKTKNPIRKNVGGDALNTCAKFQGLSLKNGVDIWTFVR